MSVSFNDRQRWYAYVKGNRRCDSGITSLNDYIADGEKKIAAHYNYTICGFTRRNVTKSIIPTLVLFLIELYHRTEKWKCLGNLKKELLFKQASNPLHITRSATIIGWDDVITIRFQNELMNSLIIYLNPNGKTLKWVTTDLQIDCVLLLSSGLDTTLTVGEPIKVTLDMKMYTNGYNNINVILSRSDSILSQTIGSISKKCNNAFLRSSFIFVECNMQIR